MANRTKATSKKKSEFLEALRTHGNVSRAAKESGLYRTSWYHIKEDDPDFSAEWDSAIVHYAETVLETEADRRAVEGVHHKIYFNEDGEPIGEERRYSDTLLIFRLKALKPLAYREGNSKVDVNVSGTIQHQGSIDLRLTQAHEQLEKRRHGTSHHTEPIG